MPYSKSPAYLWRHSSGLWYFKRPIPPELRKHFTSEATGRAPTHIVRSLGTHNRAQAEKAKRPHASEAEALFRRLSSGVVTRALTDQQRRLADIRAGMAEASVSGDIDAIAALEDHAVGVAEVIEAEQGQEAARRAYRIATRPETRTVREALEAWLPASGLTVQTQQEHRRTLGELLEFLGMADCLPEDIKDRQAVAYVEKLNDGPLSYATKKGRLSSLGAIWKHLGRKRALPRPLQTLWQGHDITGERRSASKAADEEDSGERRHLTDAELTTLFRAPDWADKRNRTYGRGLFRELYALGLTTGMRLNEIVSLRPDDVRSTAAGGLVLSIPRSKTTAGIRSIPVVHPVAVAVLERRAAAQSDPRGRLFSECAPGGPDGKPSWHVSKAMGRDRDRLGIPPGADFHSTRGNFSAMVVNKGLNADHVKQYVGHVIDDPLRQNYGATMSAEGLRPVAVAVRYSDAIEEELRRAL